MGLATPPPRPTTSKPALSPRAIHFGSTSMSQGFHQGIFSFSDGFDRSAAAQASQHHIAQQSRRDKLRGVQGFDPSGHPLVPPIDDDDDDDGGPTGGHHHHGYEPGSAAGNMLSEMFNFPPAPGGPSATDLLASQISAGYRMPVGRQGGDVGFSGEWYGAGRPQGLNADSAAAMQLFLMNPPPAPPHQQASPNQAYQAAAAAAGSFGVGESQGLSLSLSSSLQQFEMAKAAADHQNELRVRDGVLYFNSTGQQQQQQLLSPSSLHLHGQQSQGHGQPGQQQQQHMGYGGGGGGGHMAVVNVLRSSKYARAAQELLEEFCSVGRGQLKGSRIGRHHGASSSSNPNNNNNNPSSSSAAAGGAGSSSSAKEPPPLSPADRFEHQRKKSKLLSMLDEVDRRYNHYCDQMQLVVNSFDSVMGFGAATPYTALAQKAMSRHFRCLKDAIAAQLKKTCELLGEKDAGAAGAGSGITKGETPRLRLLDQSLRQQRAFHQMGMMEQEAWRPQRGLPERSVSILRAWLFEHFLHPYPSDADKHLLARQTGLSRNQVSNWFINARVRLWKPMVEEMYQQESKDEGAEDGQAEEGAHQRAEDGQRAESEAPESSPSPASISRHHHMFPSDHPPAAGAHQPADDAGPIQLPVIDPHELCGPDEDLYRQYGASTAAAVRFGAAAATTGDVTLTLGLRHAGNAPEKGRFSVRDFGGI